MQVTLKSGRQYKGEIDMGLADEGFTWEETLEQFKAMMSQGSDPRGQLNITTEEGWFVFPLCEVESIGFLFAEDI